MPKAIANGDHDHAKQKLRSENKAMSMCDNLTSNKKNGHGKENNQKLHQTVSGIVVRLFTTSWS